MILGLSFRPRKTYTLRRIVEKLISRLNTVKIAVVIGLRFLRQGFSVERLVCSSKACHKPSFWPLLAGAVAVFSNLLYTYKIYIWKSRSQESYDDRMIVFCSFVCCTSKHFFCHVF